MAPNLQSIARLPVFALVAKYYMLIINVIFLLSGLLLIGLGSYAYDQGLPGLTSTSIAVGIIIVGIVFFLVSFLGFLGAIRENRRVMVAYLIFVLVFGIIQLSIAIAAYARRDAVPLVAEQTWTVLYESASGKDTILDLETTINCCGWADPTHLAVPTNCLETLGYTVGCKQGIVEVLTSSLVTVGAIAAVLGTLQLFTLIMSCVVIKFFKPKLERDAALVGSDE